MCFRTVYKFSESESGGVVSGGGGRSLASAVGTQLSRGCRSSRVNLKFEVFGVISGLKHQ